MTEAELEAILRSEPIIGPDLGSLTIPPNPASDEVALIGGPHAVSTVPVKEAVTKRATSRDIGEDSFKSQVELWYFGEMGKVQAAGPRRAIPVGHGTELIVHKSICIERHPISDERQTIAQ